MTVDELLKNRPVQAVILCGGLGTRLRPYTDRMPKPMIPCNGKPFLWYLLQQLHIQGIQRFVLLTGYLSEQIKDYFGHGCSWEWQIQYSQGPVEWGTGKRLWEAQNKLDNRFLLLYSDNFVPFPMDKILSFHEKHGLPLTFMVSQKSPGNIALDETGIVQKFDKNRSTEGLNYVEIGYMIVEKERTLDFYENPECSFTSIIRKMVAKQKISAWIQHDAYHSISDQERWKKAEEYLKLKKILLIDRDGVINRKAPQGEYISNWEKFEWIVESRKAMRELARDGFEYIIITNQAGVARGMVKMEEINRIHRNMIDIFREDGIRILDVYVCPHHWNEGCFCRKPSPGMLLQASREHLFRLDKTIFIGDDSRDCQTAWNAGCRSIFLGDSCELTKLEKTQQPDYVTSSLMDSLDFIREFFK